VQEKIRTLSLARETFLAQQRKDTNAPETLDTAIAKTIREQARKAGLEWGK
ncbi:MAG: hypothetical protein JWL81_2159, partial [Verrucomicrobiales bacterium]|nr:hypothetical protein [Verrucomicrobiales bacterium]